MYLTENSSNNELCLTKSPTQLSYWSFMAVPKRRAETYTFNYTFTQNGVTKTFNTSTIDYFFGDHMENLGYSQVEMNSNYSYLGTVLGRMTYDDIFVFSGKGAPADLCFYTTEHAMYGRMVADGSMINSYEYTQISIDSLADNALSRTRCVLYMANESGNPYGVYNLVDATYQKGAHFVLGIKDSTVIASNLTIWLDKFWESISLGFNIQEALDEADKYGQQSGFTITYYTRGDLKQILNN